MEKENKIIREFKLTTLALKNKSTAFMLTLFLAAFGWISYQSMPKELFPDIVMPYVMVQTVYPGNPPIDIENLISRPIEKELESIKGIKNLTSTSAQDASMVFVEFNSNIKIDDALQDVKDAVDKVKSDLPNDLPRDPLVTDIDFSEFPIININLSGDYSIDELKDFAETLEDEIESISEISKVQIQGVNEREIKINVDQMKLEAFNMNFGNIEGAIAQENISISGGDINVDGTTRSIRTVGEFKSMDEIRNIIVKHEKGNIVYLKDVAEVVDGYEDATSYARLDKHPVVSLQVVKKGGENLLSATAKIEEVLKRVKDENILPSDLKITTTNDQSENVKKQLTNLENSMIMSVILVVLVLFFFLGTRNALFVGIAIPLSMFMSFIILDGIGFRVNMIVLFALILALGMLVDNAIVVVENIYRYIDSGYSKMESAKQAVGEIAIPIIASTATTLAAFFPLAFWHSIMGEFMKYLPITLIVVLTSSLFVALVLIPVFSATYIKKGAQSEPPRKKVALRVAAVLAIFSTLFFVLGKNALGNLSLLGLIITLSNLYFFNRLGKWFQSVFLVKLENLYDRILRFALRKRNPSLIFGGTILLLFLTIGFMIARKPKVEFFPSSDPLYINVLAELPIGTDIDVTDRLMTEMDDYVTTILEPYQSIIKSVLTNVGSGAILPNKLSGGESNTPNKGLITVTFLDYQERNGINTADIMKMMSDSLIGKYPGVLLTIEKNKFGPPTGSPINIEVSGKDYDKLIETSDSIQNIIESANIAGIEGIKMDLQLGKPEMIVTIDRDKARRFGLSTAQIASTIRTALFGKEVSDYKEGEDEYPILLRMMDKYRNNISSLMNQKITFRNTRGVLLQVPISSVADFSYSTTYGSVRRKDVKRVITLYSNVIEGYNANEINDELKSLLKGFDVPGYEYKFTGEQQDMAESMEFLSRAMLIAVALIAIILVTQFNSVIKPLIIIFSIILSTIGVFGGIATFKMNFIVVMSGIGIVSLAGIVVNNAIVLIDYIELLRLRKKEELGLGENDRLPLDVATECIVLGGKTRLRPVLLTAITTVLGLIPMAIGLNIDFESLLTSFDPKISIGGDMTAMWAPISWTIIFGLSFATFLTLVVVPVMFRISVRLQYFFADLFMKKKEA